MKFEATLVMMEPMSRYSAPGLTTCQMAVYEKGRYLGGWLVLDIRGNSLLGRGRLHLHFPRDKFH